MGRPRERRLGPLLREVAAFQLKLVGEAVRDLVLVPVSLGAALLDLVLIRRQAPRFFTATQRIARRTEQQVDQWSAAARDRYGAMPESVDGLLAHVEAVVREPRSGAHKARVLRRWVEIQMARRRVRGDVTGVADGSEQPAAEPGSDPGRAEPR